MAPMEIIMSAASYVRLSPLGFGSVLRVVDEKVGAIDEFGVSQIFP